MHRTLARRLQSLLLALVFVSGSFGVSGLDALLRHGELADWAAAERHLELPGGCGAHSEHCALGVHLAHCQLAHAAADRLGEAGDLGSPAALLPAPRPRGPVPDLLLPSRAPPLRLG